MHAVQMTMQLGRDSDPCMKDRDDSLEAAIFASQQHRKALVPTSSYG